MKRISDVMNEGVNEVQTPGKQQILSSDLSNRQSLNESLILDYDQLYEDVDFTKKFLRAYHKELRNDPKYFESSNILTTTGHSEICLQEYLNNYGDFPLPNWLTAVILRDISNALAHLHSSQLVHTSVTFENIYIIRNSKKACLYINQSLVRRVHMDTVIDYHSENLSQLGLIIFKCLTGIRGNVIPTATNINKEIVYQSMDALQLSRKMMARRFRESAAALSNHPFVLKHGIPKPDQFLNL